MRSPAALLALCGACVLLAVTAQNIDNRVSLDFAPPGFQVSQQSVSFPSLINSGQINSSVSAIYEIPANSPLLAQTPGSTQYTPDQVHVTLGDNGTIWVSWATGTYQNYTNPSAPAYPAVLYDPQYPDPASVASVVEWSTVSGGPYTKLASGTTRAYIQTYLHDGNTYVSQLFHHVNVRNLPFGVPIYYKVGDPSLELSVEYSITLKTSLKPSNTYTYPLRLGVVADVGQTLNSSVTYTHLVASNPDAVIFVGDLAYADDYTDKGGGPTSLGAGKYAPAATPVKYGGTSLTQGQTWQPRWDTMNRLLSRAGNGTSIPYLFCPGNHEIERDEFLRTFQAYTNRYRHSYEASYSTNPLYYSTDIGPVHSIMLNSYDSYLPNTTLDQTSAFLSALSPNNATLLFGNAGNAGANGAGGPSFPNGNYVYSSLGADQLAWLINDLARVNRAVTPWVTVSWHQPPYNSYTTHYKESECLRQMVEPFLYNFGVDVVFHGHVHAYERNYQTLNYNMNGCSPRWITMGDGGNQEGVYSSYAGTGATCNYPTNPNSTCAVPNFGTTAPGQQINPAACATFQNGTFTPVNGVQPPYSAYREPSFGHAIMTVFNATTALWEWKRNLDGVATVTDSVYFVRNPQCNNYKTGTPLTTIAPATTQPPATTASPSSTIAPPIVTVQPVAVNPIQAIVNADQALKGAIAGQLFQG